MSLAAAGAVRAVGRPPHRRHGLGRASPERYAALAETQSDSRAPPRRPAHARPGALLRGPLRGVARAHEAGARELRPDRASRSRPSLRPRPARRSRQLQGLEPLAPGLPRPGRRDDRGQSAVDPRGRPRQHDRPRPLLRHDDQHLAAPAGPGRGRRARGAAPRRGDDPAAVARLGLRSTSAGPCRSRARRPASTRSRPACARRGRSAPAGFEPFHLGLAAEAYARAGRHDEAWAKTRPSVRGPGAGPSPSFRRRAAPPRGRPVVARRSRAERPQPRRTSAEPWRSHASRKSPSLQLRAARDLARLWPSRASGGRPPICWPRSMAGSPRASIRRT